jgi:phage shock protein A
MFAATLKLVIHELLELFRRGQLFLQSLGAERRCALRMDRVADRLAGMGARIDTLRARLQQEVDQAIDADGMLRDSLRGLKEDIRGIRCQLAALRRPQLSARVQRAFARLSQVAEQTYASADRLQWEIEEHDQALQ